MKPLIMLAPLAGYTNLAYRTMMKEFGCDIVVSEMISDYALFYQNKETEKMLATSKEERPVALQLFGGSKESLLNGLKEMEAKADYDYLDINLGCPVQKVIKSNAGSAWLKAGREEELYEAISALVKASSKPVTCKIRLGWDKDSLNYLKVASLLEKAGCTLLTVHGRTRAQMYEGNPDYNAIKEIKETVKIPVIANGNINTLDKAIEVLDYTKADGVALGRGCLGNPYLITQIKEYYQTGKKLPLPDIHTQLGYLVKHFEGLKALKGDYSAINEIRGIGTWYLKGFTHVKDYKVALSKITNDEELYRIVDEIFSNPLIERVND